MRCRNCEEGRKSKSLVCKPLAKGFVLKRRRKCGVCKHTWSTWEVDAVTIEKVGLGNDTKEIMNKLREMK